MDVHLYVYDLSQGLAKQYSAAFLGIHIDAIYHTAIVLNGVEYFYGAGIQTCSPPGTTHHGRPIEVVKLGSTDLPPDIINSYLQSLAETYTAAAYDLFLHNCNNFTNDFAEFLVGKGIPKHIQSLPQRVLETPFGAMIKSQIGGAMQPIVQNQESTYGHVTSSININGHVHVNGNSSRKEQLPELDALGREMVLYTDPIWHALDDEVEDANSLQGDPAFKSLRKFVETHQDSRAEMPLPDLHAVSLLLEKSLQKNSQAETVAFLSLVCAASAEPRVSGFFVVEHDNIVISSLFQTVKRLTTDQQPSISAYQIKSLAVRLLANVLNSLVTVKQLVASDSFRQSLTDLTCMLLTDWEGQTSAEFDGAKSGLAFNFILADHRLRTSNTDIQSQRILTTDDCVGIASALVFAIHAEVRTELATKRFITTLGYLLRDRRVTTDGADLWDLLESLEAGKALRAKATSLPGERTLVEEVLSLLQVPNA